MEFTMEVKIMTYCYDEYHNYLLYGGNLEKVIDRCYGAVMFAINNCFDNYNETVAKWWEDEMLPKFKALNFKEEKY